MVSLIVATLNRVAEVDRLLTSLDGQIYKQFEVIVVDQNPDERLVPLFEKHPELVIKHLRSQPGISRARNAGLCAADGDIIAIPDDDCWYPKQLLGQVAVWFRSHPEFGILNVVKRSAENELVGPNWPAAALNCTRADVWRCAISSALFMRRSVCEAVGDFNEALGVGAASRYQSGEETDYVLRALEQGFQMWYEPSLTVHHPPLHSIDRAPENVLSVRFGRRLRLKSPRLSRASSRGTSDAFVCRGSSKSSPWRDCPGACLRCYAVQANLLATFRRHVPQKKNTHPQLTDARTDLI